MTVKIITALTNLRHEDGLLKCKMQFNVGGALLI